ncbi:MAG TPA: hypothetical protein VJ622_18215 [Acidimicrobiia bacterium]|nr:hypothetical protein [Acidimicrobiia bacterium]
MNLWIWLRSEWDRVAGFALVGLGAVLLLFGYLGVKDSPFVAEQLAYIASGGLGGIFCLGIGVGLLLSADLHDEWRKLDRIEAAMRGEALPDPTGLLDLAGSGTTPSAGGSRAPVAAAQPRLVGHAPVMAINWREDGLRRALALSGAVLLAPLAVMGVGWRTANQTTSLDTAARGVGVAVLGLAVALAVVGLYTFWIRARTVSRKDRLFGARLLMEQLAERRRHEPRPAAATGSCDDTEVLVAAGSHRFHRAGCASLAGLETTAVDRRTIDAGLAPCGLCGAR